MFLALHTPFWSFDKQANDVVLCLQEAKTDGSCAISNSNCFLICSETTRRQLPYSRSHTFTPTLSPSAEVGSIQLCIPFSFFLFHFLTVLYLMFLVSITCIISFSFPVCHISCSFTYGRCLFAPFLYFSLFLCSRIYVYISIKLHTYEQCFTYSIFYFTLFLSNS